MTPGPNGLNSPETPPRFDEGEFLVSEPWPGDDTVAVNRGKRSEPRDVDPPERPLKIEVVSVPQDILDAIETMDEFDEAWGLGTPVATVTRRPDKRKKRAPKVEPEPVDVDDIPDEDLFLDSGVEPIYSTTEAAQFFDRTTQWIYWGLRGDPPVFVRTDGSPIIPDRLGPPPRGRRRFTLPIIKEILLSSYRRGNISSEELNRILRRILINERGGDWREREGWRKIKSKWAHPDQCKWQGNKWVKIKEDETDD
jgi:hypothetical protein